MDQDNTENGTKTGADKLTGPTSRRALMLGAAAASAVVTVRPALAQTAGSVLNCQIPVPGPHGTGMNIDADGQLVAPDTPGSFTATGQKYHRRTGQRLRCKGVRFRARPMSRARRM